MATSHGPQLSIPGDQWSALIEKDQKDRRMDYQALLAKAPAGIEKEITLDKMVSRYEACQRDLDTLSEVLLEARPDVMVVLGDDQHEQFGDDNMPIFALFNGEEMPVVRRGSRAPREADNLGFGTMAWNQLRVERPEPDKAYPGRPSLANHLITTLCDAGFDIARSNKLREGVGLGHAFTMPYTRLMNSQPIPMVPVMINTFFPPNQPTPKRCYALGQALREAIEDWDSNQRVVVMASGGLSHVIIDEEIDQMTLDGLRNKDADALCSLPVDRLNLGTSEIRNWIGLAGCVEDMDMTLIDYQPCYRSPAATGCAMGFAYWN
jgi:hypothetical protein